LEQQQQAKLTDNSVKLDTNATIFLWKKSEYSAMLKHQTAKLEDNSVKRGSNVTMTNKVQSWNNNNRLN
jgi:hypothetical protein